MKTCTVAFLTIAATASTTSAFQSLVTGRTTTTTTTPLSLNMAPNDDRQRHGGDPKYETLLDKAEEAIESFEDGVKDVIDRGEKATATGLSPEKEQDMWESQRQLQKDRNKHSTKAGRMEKYDEPPIIENDHHDELNKPWTKEGGDDHYSVNGKL